MLLQVLTYMYLTMTPVLRPSALSPILWRTLSGLLSLPL